LVDLLNGLYKSVINANLTLSSFVKIKVIIVFLNGNPYFLLYILVAYHESFPKYCNKVTSIEYFSSYEA